MIGRNVLAASLAAAVAATGAAIVWNASAEEAPDATRLLFVQSIASGTYSSGVLTLTNPSGLTLWFADRPDHRSGLVKDAEFVASWDEGEDSFASDPPNAVFYTGANEQVAVMELLGVSREGHAIAYTVKVTSGAIPASFAGGALFIDDDTAASGRNSDYNGMGSSTNQMINSLNH